MHYYLKADLRNCHEGDKIEIIGKSGMYIQVLMDKETVNIPTRIFPTFFSKNPVDVSPARDHAVRQEYHSSVVVCKRTCKRR